MKVNDEKEKMPVSRRLFVGRIGSFGLGAVGASSLLAACGSNNNNTRQSVGSATVTSGELTTAFRNIQIDEVTHVNDLRATIMSLGGTPRPKPTFNAQGAANAAVNAAWNPADIPTLVQLSAALENTGTGAYLAQVTQPSLLGNPPVLQAAAGIDVVEGRHAGFLNSLQDSIGKGQRPLLTDPNTNDTALVANAIEVPLTSAKVLMRAAPFLGNYGQTQGATLDTNLMGVGLGQGLDTNSAALVDILNYALLLEYLEATFYNNNVPRLFGVPQLQLV